MINLLPSKDHEELLLEKNRKIVIILAASTIVVLLCFWLILFSLKLYVLGEVGSQRAFSDSIEKIYQTPEFATSKATVERYNDLIKKVNVFYRQQGNTGDIMGVVLGVDRPQGVWLTSIAVDQDDAGQPLVTLYGVSDTRDNLVIFKNNLQSNHQITHLVFPANNWIKPKDVSFSLTFGVAVAPK